MEPIWLRGEEKPEFRRTLETLKKQNKKRTKNEKTYLFSNVGRFSQKLDGSTVRRLLWYYQQL